MASGSIPNTHTWKLIDTATGTTPIRIYGVSASEFLVIVNINDSGNKQSIQFPASEVSGNSWYRSGGYVSMFTPALVTILVNTDVTLVSAALGTTDYTSGSKISVYYR